jgi:hypothetical protein
LYGAFSRQVVVFGFKKPSTPDEGSFERGPDQALCVHRVVYRRHHPEKGVDHAGEILVLDRDASAAQRFSVTLTVVVQYVTFRSNDDCRCNAYEIVCSDRRGAPVIRIPRGCAGNCR